MIRDFKLIIPSPPRAVLPGLDTVNAPPAISLTRTDERMPGLAAVMAQLKPAAFAFGRYVIQTALDMARSKGIGDGKNPVATIKGD